MMRDSKTNDLAEWAARKMVGAIPEPPERLTRHQENKRNRERPPAVVEIVWMPHAERDPKTGKLSIDLSPLTEEQVQELRDHFGPEPSAVFEGSGIPREKIEALVNIAFSKELAGWGLLDTEED